MCEFRLEEEEEKYIYIYIYICIYIYILVSFVDAKRPPSKGFEDTRESIDW